MGRLIKRIKICKRSTLYPNLTVNFLMWNKFINILNLIHEIITSQNIIKYRKTVNAIYMQ